VQLDRYEYSLTANVRGVPRNAAFFFRSLLGSRDQTVVLGAEPYDPRVLYFDRLKRRHRVVLHSSWPFWDGEFVPQEALLPRQRSWWESFLDGLTAVCPTATARDALAAEGADAHHVPHAVDTEMFHPTAGPTEAHDGPSNEDGRVMFAGRLESRKGVPTLLSIAADWRDRGVDVRFAGAGPLASTVTETPGATRLGFLDRETLAEEYAAADVVVLPSHRADGWEELFGIVVIEAFASGTPVVATDCVGPAELISDGETGYVVPQHDETALANRIERLLTHHDARQRMGENARREAETMYDIDAVAEQWANVLTENHPGANPELLDLLSL
jgi:glycosyltransferase involved in cell wall biosynthesis